MGCCGGRGRARPRAKPPAPDRGRQVLACYEGSRPLFSIRGTASGEKVYFAATEEDRYQVVWSGDLEAMGKAGVVYVGELGELSQEGEGVESVE